MKSWGNKVDQQNRPVFFCRCRSFRWLKPRSVCRCRDFRWPVPRSVCCCRGFRRSKPRSVCRCRGFRGPVPRSVCRCRGFRWRVPRSVCRCRGTGLSLRRRARVFMVRLRVHIRFNGVVAECFDVSDPTPAPPLHGRGVPCGFLCASRSPPLKGRGWGWGL